MFESSHVLNSKFVFLCSVSVSETDRIHRPQFQSTPSTTFSVALPAIASVRLLLLLVSWRPSGTATVSDASYCTARCWSSRQPRRRLCSCYISEPGWASCSLRTRRRHRSDVARATVHCLSTTKVCVTMSSCVAVASLCCVGDFSFDRRSSFICRSSVSAAAACLLIRRGRL